ncbi:MAG TPA: ribosomal L7Ae/L30e/S12e/Gadd45 family protein [Longimicrobiaceae bacterium]|jgi:ribosomal protein L7Ae-like RNA K-turn-binding protein|nr:ribosomal L7Ae/L30e/S12e/Gadd45 family protein [Longimicrobiaceae bacterium]
MQDETRSVPARPERALLDLLGLAARARALASGTDAARQAVRDGEVRCVIVAADASPTQAKKLVPLMEARGVRFFTCLSRESIGAATGRGPVSAVGITNDSFARRAAELAAALSS